MIKFRGNYDLIIFSRYFCKPVHFIPDLPPNKKWLEIWSKSSFVLQSNLWINAMQGIDGTWPKLTSGLYLEVLFYQGRVIEVLPLFTGWSLFTGGIKYKLPSRKTPGTVNHLIFAWSLFRENPLREIFCGFMNSHRILQMKLVGDLWLCVAINLGKIVKIKTLWI